MIKMKLLLLVSTLFLFGFGNKNSGFTKFTNSENKFSHLVDSTKNIKERLQNGEILKGAVINIAHPIMIETVCAAGADFLFLDFEHGLRDYNDIGTSIMAAQLSGVPTLVRLGERSANLVERMLDGGAAGFIFPHVETAEEAAELVAWCRYKPLGVRGSGFARASIPFKGIEYDRRQQASKDVVCIMIIENLKGKENLAKILAVEGVTGVAIGPGDLSMELGVSDWKHPKVTKILDEMAVIIKSFPKSAFLRLALMPDEAVQHVASGANMIIVTHDWQLIKNMYAGLFKDISTKINQAKK
jgi:2-keto-3-deoxy-L-rhamnonate aldolase RhmA